MASKVFLRKQIFVFLIVFLIGTLVLIHNNRDENNMVSRQPFEFSRRCNRTYNCKHNTTKHLPKVLIIGVAKSGTNALEWFLQLHAQIRITALEPNFFNLHYKKGLDWYCRKMPCTRDHVMVMERTPSYYADLVQKKVYDFDKNMKLLLIVRDPVDRMISHLVNTYGLRSWEFYKKKAMHAKTGLPNESHNAVYMSQYYK